MSPTAIGLVVGLLLAIAAVVGGFTGFLLAVVLGGVGWAVGAVIEGRIDLGSLLGGRRRG
jgi:hypothetical protein